MRLACFVSLLFLAIAARSPAQPPAIQQEGVRNAASRMPPSLPGGALAPGVLFTLEGLRLAGGNSETRIHIKQANTDLEAQVISADAGRIEARMPLQAPSGDSQLVVTRDGQSSRTFAIRVAPAAFGIFARNGRGWGPGEIFNSDPDKPSGETLNTPAAPAQAGSVATLVGTGLGVASAPEVFVGGKPARVLSLGPRSVRPGVEEVRFQVAKDTPAGCYVPVVVKLPQNVSNVVTMSIAPKGQACSGSPGPGPLLVLARLLARVQLRPGYPVDLTRIWVQQFSRPRTVQIRCSCLGRCCHPPAPVRHIPGVGLRHIWRRVRQASSRASPWRRGGMPARGSQ